MLSHSPSATVRNRAEADTHHPWLQHVIGFSSPDTCHNVRCRHACEPRKAVFRSFLMRSSFVDACRMLATVTRSLDTEYGSR